jgi:hypothetical protein
MVQSPQKAAPKPSNGASGSGVHISMEDVETCPSSENCSPEIKAAKRETRNMVPLNASSNGNQFQMQMHHTMGTFTSAALPPSVLTSQMVTGVNSGISTQMGIVGKLRGTSM